MNEARYREAEATFWRTHGMDAPAEHWVRLAATGTNVRVLEWGEGDPALFIHGGPNAASGWVSLVAHLEGFRCLLVDRPGTGLSDPFPLRTSNLPAVGARFVGDVLDGLGLERAHVVASSIGGHLALRSAAHAPERFGRMVQMACPAVVPGDRMPPFMAGLRNPVTRRLATLFPPNPKMNASILRQIGHGASLDAGRLPTGMDAWYLEMQRHTDTMKSDLAAMASIVRDHESVRLSERDFRAVPVPTRFLWGADDTFGGEDVARRLVGWMPDAELTMIPDAGHLPWIDFPELIAAETAAFLHAGDRRAATKAVGAATAAPTATAAVAASAVAADPR